MQDSDERVIRRAYHAFNARDIDAALALLDPHVEWPNGMEGGVEHGREAVRAYWTRQWRQLDPHVEPASIARGEDGRSVVQVHQVVRDLSGAVLMDRMVEHVYELVGGLVTRMEIRELPPR